MSVRCLMIVLLSTVVWAGAPIGPHESFDPVYQDRGLVGESLAWDYLDQVSEARGLDVSSLELQDVKRSLLGTHYLFQQRIGAVPVEGGQIVVSMDDSQSIYRISSNLYTGTAQQITPKVILNSDDALDLAWLDLKAHGELLERPQAELVYLPEGDGFRLAYRTRTALEAPFGYWEHRIDAVNGKVLSIRSYDISRRPLDPPAAYDGPLLNRTSALVRYEQRQLEEQRARAARKAAVLANGTGQVFDPDPRTTLLDDNLQDTSPASAFNAAYFTRNLLDITDTGGTFILDGPWIEIRDFESPATPPSTTSDGNWTATRGDNAFNDANTYFHIDQNQRYIQSLGFTGATGIQEGPIETDSDGLSGADNSHFIPGSNRMAFGHGCVDDNEDQFVILHEYGHAIHHSINPSTWTGGDTGAMGEGFGDYWAASYRHSTPNGPAYHPEWAFPWDGHGTGSPCWPGRILNAFAAQYVHTTFYGAHSSIPGGFQSDELWSTPLFQSQLEILNQGGTREETDTIILEAHFGLTSGAKMRDMANRIIQTAGALQPGGPHQQIFIDKFLVHNIVDVPVVSFGFGQTMLTEPGSNGYADPGETVQLKVQVDNNGTLGATNIMGTLSTTTPMVMITTNQSAYPDIPSGGNALNTTDFVVVIDPAFTCGDPIDFNLHVTYDEDTDGPLSTDIGFSMGTGAPVGADMSISPGLAIIDNTTVMSSMTITGSGATVTANFNVDVDITHTFIGDLLIDLESPDGTVVRLHNGTGGTTDDIVGNYPGTLTPAEPLSAFIGDQLDGMWTLTIEDTATQDQGTLNSWAIHDVSGYDCESAVDPCTFATFAEVMGFWGSPNAIYDFNTTGLVDVLDVLEYLNLCP